MESKIQTNLSFGGVDILNVFFTAHKYTEAKVNVDVKITPQVFYPPENKKQFKLILEIVILLKDHFELAVYGMGNFEVSEDLDAASKKSFVSINAVAIMFPYMRSFISTFTSNVGRSVTPIILPPYFFSGEIKEITIEEMLEAQKKSQEQNSDLTKP